MPLDEYRRRRHFDRTAEPPPTPSAPSPSASRPLVFVVQEHHASRLHWDFRLELDGVLKSWAVPKGPPEEPGPKRLAQMVEDHPLEYADFVGEIPTGEYGAGSVTLWDHGTWEPVGDTPAAEQLAQGSLKLVLHGERLQGGYALFRFRRAGDNSWLLIKEKS